MSGDVTKRVFINNIETPVRDVHTVHDVDHPIATGSLTMPAPRPAHVELGVPVIIYAGYDGSTSVIFRGQVADDNAAFSENGRDLRVELEGDGKRLWYAQRQELVIAGQQSLKGIFSALCKALGVPRYFADLTTTPDGYTVIFGGISVVDGGNIVIPKDASAGDVVSRLARLYGYRTFDRNDGYYRLKKVSGLPATSATRSYVEGENVLRIEQGRTLDGVYNDIEVLGARYTAADTSEVAVRSIAATAQYDARFGPSGISHLRIQDPAILTNLRADDVRNVAEIDRSTPYFRWKWSATGDPAVMPGQVVSATSPTVGTNTALWLMRVAHSITDGGWTTDMEAWSGAGSALPAGNDCVVYPLVGSTGFHIGNEYLSHYRTPNPAGLEKVISGSVPEGYSTLTLRCRSHGANSFAGNTSSTASKFEIWQTVDGEYKSVASGEFPRQNENLERRLDYTVDANSPEVVIPMSGSMKAGPFDLKCISGYDSNVGDYDDYEFFNLSLTACGIGEPVITI